MTDPLRIRESIVVPADAMTMQAVRSSGPGGQNVNKVASKVELRVDLSKIVGLDSFALARLQNLARPLLDADGQLLVKSQKTRDQRQNLEDARDKVRVLVEKALVRPKTRRKTKPTRGSVERRLGEKKARSKTKSDRRGRVD
ncbi:MAG: alternative ribosome rescue aminoacyl-tRNA hydrolase ArfB [Polyangiaceae bacterium]